MITKILFVAAMEREFSCLQKYYKCKLDKKLFGIYPFYKASNIGIVQTHIGDTNATIATLEAIRIFKPNYVFKIGCAGGNSPDIHTGDIFVPTSIFHGSTWMTRSKIDYTTTPDASLWQSIFGNNPYQLGFEYLGKSSLNISPDKKIMEKYKKFLKNKNIKYVDSYLGSGNIWFSDLKFMKEILKTQVPDAINNHLSSDMESYSIAMACYVNKIPFFGFYRISNSDFYNEPFILEKVSNLFEIDFVKIIDEFINLLK
jgi:nucleoside phosphorylase